MGLRDVTRLRVHHLRHDPDQHVIAGHEVLPTAGTVHAVPRCPQRHLHRLLHYGVRPQTRGVQIQSKYLVFIYGVTALRGGKHVLGKISKEMSSQKITV